MTTRAKIRAGLVARYGDLGLVTEDMLDAVEHGLKDEDRNNERASV